MTNLQEILASLLDRLVSEVGKVPGLDEEFRRARTEFFGPRKPEPISVARFEEWFLFERRSPRLGDAPAFVALAARIQPRVSAPIQELLDELAANSYGVFELVSEEGEVSARDLLSERQLSLDPEQAELLEGAMDEASVIVGRLFPSGRGSYLFGRGAVAVGGGVAKALRGDLAMPGKDRRQRISQLQMERLLFFDVGAPERSEGDPAESEPIERIEAEVDQWLRESVTDGFGIEDLRERFLKSPTIDEAVEPTLEELAFETDADLDLGRRLLPSYYRALHGRKRAPKPEVSAAARADELRAKASELLRMRIGAILRRLLPSARRGRALRGRPSARRSAGPSHRRARVGDGRRCRWG